MRRSALLVSASLAAASPLVPRVPEVTEDDIKTFNYLAEHSAASYCNTLPPNIDEPIACANNACPILSSHNTSILGVYDSAFQGIRAYTAIDHDNKEIILAIRAADDPQMWAQASNFTLSDWPLVDDAQAHQQFIVPWETMNAQDAVAKTLTRAKTQQTEYTIKATGHSLGGAIAMLAAAQLRLENNMPIDVYSFGAPRLGNDHLSRFIEEQKQGKEFRITHLNDYITRLPRPDYGYRHVSNEYWLKGESATGDTYPMEDVQVCEGLLNMDCNGGTTGIDFDVHFTYFGDIRGCI